MLKYFFGKDTSEINRVKKEINEIKKKLLVGEFDFPSNPDEIVPLFQKTIDFAKEVEDERLANSTFVAKSYYLIFSKLVTYFALLNKEQYKESWIVLQDCLDLSNNVTRFTDVNDRLDITQLVTLLVEYEKLYPYSVFLSHGSVKIKSHCSICGEAWNLLGCSHMKGYLYWGKVAVEVIEKIDIKEVSIVENPKDKRCVAELSDDKRTNREKFHLLHLTSKNLPHLLCEFNVRINKSSRRAEVLVFNNGSPMKFFFFDE